MLFTKKWSTLKIVIMLFSYAWISILYLIPNFLESFAGMVQILGVTVFVVPLVAVLEHIAIAKAFGMVIAEHCLLIFIYMIYLLNFIHILNCFDLTK